MPDRNIEVDLSCVLDTGAISGTISSASAPLAGAIVSALQGGSVILSTTANGSGVYTLSSLVPGSYDVQASATNYQTATQTGVTVISDQTTTENVSLTPDPGAFAGVVTNATLSPLGGVSVSALQGGIVIESTTTDLTNGSYILSSLAPGSYTVRATLSTYQTQNVSASIVLNQTTTQNFALQLDPGAIVGTISDSITALPIESAAVQALSGLTIMASTSSAVDGSYSLTGLTPNSYTVRAGISHYETGTTGTTVTPGGTATANLALYPNPGALSGVITDSGLDVGLSGAAVALYKSGSHLADTTTASNGAYLFASLDPAMTYSIQASLTHYQAHTVSPITIVSDQTTIESFSLTPNTGGITGTVRNSLSGGALVGATVEALQAGAVVQSTTTVSGGGYTFASPFTPGSYVVQASLSQYGTASLAATVTSDTISTEDFSLVPDNGTISGTVNDSITAYPLSGVTITILQGGSTIATTTTATNGIYSASLAPGTYDVRASLANYTQQTISSITVESDATQTVDFVLAALPGAISGSINVGSGATVQALQGVVVVASTTSGSFGGYTLTSLPPGTYTVRASLFDHGAVVYPSPVTVAANTTTSGINISLYSDSGTIAGFVRNSLSVGVSGATVRALQGGVNIFSTTTDVNGFYNMNVLLPGTYTVEALLVGYAAGTQSATVVGGSVSEVDFSLSSNPGTISGTIVCSSTSIGIGGEAITISKGGIVIQTTISAHDGTYTTSAILAAGSDYTVSVAASAHYGSATQSGITVTGGGIATVNFALTPNTGTIEGTVEDSVSHAGIVGASVEAFQGGVLKGSSTTGVGGAYTISTLLPGNYDVHVINIGYQTATVSATVVPDQITTVDVALVLDTGTLSGTIRTALSGEPIAGAIVNVLQGIDVISSVTADGSGSYSFSLAPGSYNVQALAATYQTAIQMGITVESDATTIVDFFLSSEPGTVFGTAADASHSPLGGVSVSALQGGVVIATTTTAPTTGDYFLNLRPGSYTIRAVSGGYQTAYIGTIVSSDQLVSVTFALQGSPKTISGTVVGESPISGATVEVIQGSVVVATATTDASGAYSISTLAPGLYTVRASAAGYQTALLGADLVAFASVNFTLNPAPEAVSGTVQDVLTGHPINGALVEVLQGQNQFAATLANGSGFYSIDGLAPGAYTIIATAPTYQANAQAIIAGSVSTVNVSLTLSPGSVIGAITHGGAAIPSAFVDLLLGDVVLQSAVTDNDGNYALFSVQPGTYTVRVQAESFQSGSQVVAVAASQTAIADMTLASLPVSITGVVSDSSTQPIAGSAIAVYGEGTLLASTVAGPDGSYTIAGLAIGTYIVRASATNYQTFLQGASLPSAAPVNFTLETSPGSIGGTVFEAASPYSPLPNATIVVLHNSISIAKTQTDASGNYLISGLSPGPYVVRASCALFQAEAIGALVGASTATVDFSLAANPGGIGGQVTDQSTGDPLANAALDVFLDQTIFATAYTDSNGNYAISTLAPGEYCVRARLASYQTAIVGAAVASGSTTTISPQLQPNPGQVVGTVLSSSTPLAGAVVEVFDNLALVASTLSAPDGTYALHGIAPGPYVVRATLAGYHVASLGASVEPGASATANFSLNSSVGSLSGHVQDQLANPEAGVAIDVFVDSTIVASTVTDPVGNYTFSTLAPTTYTVRASLSGRQAGQQSAMVVLPPHPTAEANFTLLLNPGIIAGSVASAVSAPISEAAVTIFSGTAIVGEATTAYDGSFTIANIAPGTYTVVVSANNFQTSSQGALVSSGSTTTVSFVLQPPSGTLVGTVANASQPLSGVAVEVLSGSDVIAAALTGNDGTYTIVNLAPGSFTVRATFSGYQTALASARIVANQTAAADFILLSAPGSISGQITDLFSTPIPGARVDLFQNSIPIFSTTTDASAQYSFENLSPASYVILASASGYSTKIVGAIVLSSHDTSITLSLQSNPGSITGTVMASGMALPGAFVDALMGTTVVASTVTDGLGDYILNDLASGDYTVRVTSTLYASQSEAVSVVGGSIAVKDFSLSGVRGSFVGQITQDGTGAPISGAVVAVLQGPEQVAAALTDMYGQYVVENLAPGQYAVVASASSYQTEAVSGAVVSGNSSAVSFLLRSTPGSLQGLVTDVSMAPIGGAEISVQQRGMIIATAFTEPDGTYFISGFASGAYVASASAEGFRTTQLGFSIEAGAAAQKNFILKAEPLAMAASPALAAYDDFVLPPNPGFIAGTITDAISALPIAGAVIDVVQNTFVVASSISMSDGTYLIGGLPPVAYTVLVTQDGYQTAAIGAIVVQNTTTTSNFALHTNPGTISGTVSDVATGDPLSGAEITFIKGSVSFGTTNTDSGGQYSFSLLPPGQYVVLATATGYGAMNIGASLDAGGTAPAFFALSEAPGVLTGTVRSASAGDPIGGAFVGVLQDSHVVKFTVTASDGTYTLSDIIPGNQSVYVQASGFQTTLIEAFVPASGTLEEDFFLSSVVQQISGLVQDASLSPIAGATVQILKNSQPIATVLTDASGAYVIPDLANVAYVIIASAQGYQTQMAGLTFPVSQSNFTLDLASATPSVQGHVYDSSSGAALSGAFIEILQQGAPAATSVTDADGAFSISSLTDGTYTVRASLPGYQTAVRGITVHAPATAASDFYLIFDAGSLGGIITDASTHSPIGGAVVQVLMEGTVLASSTADANGQYLCSDLAVGTYTVSITAGGYQSANRGATIQNDQTTTLDASLLSGGGAISGFVTATGPPTVSIPGASITILQAGAIFQQATADLLGYYFIPGLPHGAYTVRASAAGYQTQSQEVYIFSDETILALFHLNPNPGAIAGIIVDASHLALSGASVDVLQNSFLIASAVSESDGSYIVSGLGAGSYLVRVRQSGYQTATAETTVVPPGSSTVSFSLSSNPGSVGGTVLSAATGNPIQGALVSLQQQSIVIASAYADAFGTYLLSDISAGEATVIATASGYQGLAQGAFITPDQSFVDNFQLQTNPATISGTVTGAGTPLQGVVITLMQDSIVFAVVMTDSTGNYSIFGVPPGSYSVQAAYSGWETQVMAVYVSGGQTALVNFALSNEIGSIAGFVEDESSHPISSTTIQALYNNNVVASARTDSNGLYTLPDLSPGEYVVRATADGFQIAFQTATVTSGNVTTADFTLLSDPGSISGAVTDAFSGALLPGITVTASQGGTVIEQVFTDSGGLYVLTNLAPGEYAIMAVAPEPSIYQIALLTVHVQAGETTVQNISLLRNPGSIYGRVTDAVSHFCLPGMQVSVIADSTTIAFKTTDSSGSYFFYGISPGLYTVSVAGSGIYQSAAQQAFVQSNQALEVDFALQHKPGSLTGVVTSAATGEPISMASVMVSRNGVVIATAFSDGQGIYTIYNLPEGRYKAVAAKSGYASETKETTIITTEQTVCSFRLAPRPLPPKNLHGCVKKKKHSYEYALRWKRSCSRHVRGYHVYRDGKFVGAVSEKSKLKYTDFRKHRKKHMFCVRTENRYGALSHPTCTTLGKCKKSPDVGIEPTTN